MFCGCVATPRTYSSSRWGKKGRGGEGGGGGARGGRCFVKGKVEDDDDKEEKKEAGRRDFSKVERKKE